MHYLQLRKTLGNGIVLGSGVEIGAGLRPVLHDGIVELILADNRTKSELTDLFGPDFDFDILNIDDLIEARHGHFDFVTSHHVLEHCDNPIKILRGWISMLNKSGVLYLSVPSPSNSTELGRPVATIRHHLEDYFFERAASSFESKEHIPFFVCALSQETSEYHPWYAKSSVQDFAKVLLHEISERDDHDLHWHTFDITTFSFIVKLAFYLEGIGCIPILSHESEDSLYLAFRRADTVRQPAELAEFRRYLEVVVARILAVQQGE